MRHKIFWWVSPAHPPSFVVTCTPLPRVWLHETFSSVCLPIYRSLDIDITALYRHFVTSLSEWNFLERAEGNRQSINHESPAFSSLALWFYIHVDFSCTKKKTNKFWINWVGVNTTFTIWQLSYCKFCIYNHPVSSKFTIWH